jgi:hypothetical protein
MVASPTQPMDSTSMLAVFDAEDDVQLIGEMKTGPGAFGHFEHVPVQRTPLGDITNSMQGVNTAQMRHAEKSPEEHKRATKVQAVSAADRGSLRRSLDASFGIGCAAADVPTTLRYKENGAPEEEVQEDDNGAGISAFMKAVHVPPPDVVSDNSKRQDPIVQQSDGIADMLKLMRDENRICFQEINGSLQGQSETLQVMPIEAASLKGRLISIAAAVDTLLQKTTAHDDRLTSLESAVTTMREGIVDANRVMSGAVPVAMQANGHTAAVPQPQGFYVGENHHYSSPQSRRSERDAAVPFHKRSDGMMGNMGLLPGHARSSMSWVSQRRSHL